MSTNMIILRKHFQAQMSLETRSSKNEIEFDLLYVIFYLYVLIYSRNATMFTPTLTLNILHALQQVVKGAMNSITGCMLTSGVQWYTIHLKK